MNDTSTVGKNYLRENKKKAQAGEDKKVSGCGQKAAAERQSREAKKNDKAVTRSP